MSSSDALDLTAVSVVLYFILRWLADSMSRRVLLTLAIVVAVYGVSRAFGLFLTERLLRVGGGMLALALLVAFQEDVRRGFERLAVWTRAGRDPLGVARATLDCLSEVAGRLARERVGALIVLRGRQGIESHIRGGVPLGGSVSLPLLCSIFNTKSPGHDGAVIVDGSRVERFGVHLPLSRNVEGLTEPGTRHTAGLGLSERTDALVLVVSEERGTISLAENGRLEQVPDTAHLRARLEVHYERLGLLPTTRLARRWLPAHLRLKTLAAALSLGWWLLTPPVATVHRSFTVPIQYVNLPPDTVLAEPAISESEVSLAGPDRAFDMLNPGGLRLSIDVSQLPTTARSATLTARDLSGHGLLSVERIEPDTIPVGTARLEPITLPILVRLSGESRPGVELVSAEPEPSTIRVLMATSASTPKAVDTEPVEVSQLTESQVIRTALALPPGVRLPEGEAGAVLVRVVIRLD
jgi:uncharacterized protein (TIGR00159 family)